jgi:adenylate kinase
VPFSNEQLLRLRFDLILVLRCDPEITLARIKAAPAGRKAISLELAREHQAMQQALALTYATVCGCPIHVIDSSEVGPQGIFVLASEILLECGFNSQHA